MIGVTEQQLVNICGVSLATIEKLGDSLQCLGRMTREEVLNNLQEADFTVLLRQGELRYAKAGFPTKVVESLASATPVICNLTSDLNMYIHDMQNGIIVQECSASEFCKAVKKAMGLSPVQKEKMYGFARKTAEEYFDYEQYKTEIEKLLADE